MLFRSLYSRWGDEGSILDEVGVMEASDIGILIELKDLNRRPISGARVILPRHGIIGWTYEEFLEVISETR